MIDRLETLSIKLSEAGMMPYRWLPWKRRLILPPSASIDIRYVFYAMSVRVIEFILFLVLLQVFGAIGFIQGIMSFHARYHFTSSSLTTIATEYIHAVEGIFPFIAIALIGFVILSALTAKMSAYFWNRRALRLQANPVLPAVIQNPVVWPPPPQIVD